MSLDRIEDWNKFLEPLKIAANKSSEPAQNLNRREASNAALSGDHWHDNMLRMVGSWVAKGNKEHEIHMLANAHILPGHTHEETPDPEIRLARLRANRTKKLLRL